MNHSLEKPRIGFLGVGWIGRHRMEAMAKSGRITVAAIADPSAGTVDEALKIAPGAVRCRGLEELLEQDLAGIAIATPSALHARQAYIALGKGIAVFCQKPVGRDASETRRVVETARQADRLLGVDLSYRFVTGMSAVRDLVRSGDIGRVYAADLVFHNAYGPDKPWYYNPEEAGGGCVIDLGIHLVDLALWTLDFPGVAEVSSRLYAGGVSLNGRRARVEDYAAVRIDLETDVTIQLACSWRLPAGCDALISATFYGTGGGLSFHNVNGSFYDFEGVRFRGTAREVLSGPPDEWGGRAAVAWAGQLAESPRYRGEIESIIRVAEILDRVYGRIEPPAEEIFHQEVRHERA